MSFGRLCAFGVLLALVSAADGSAPLPARPPRASGGFIVSESSISTSATTTTSTAGSGGSVSGSPKSPATPDPPSFVSVGIRSGCAREKASTTLRKKGDAGTSAASRLRGGSSWIPHPPVKLSRAELEHSQANIITSTDPVSLHRPTESSSCNSKSGGGGGGGDRSHHAAEFTVSTQRVMEDESVDTLAFEDDEEGDGAGAGGSGGLGSRRVLNQGHPPFPGGNGNNNLGLGNLSLIDRARALCAAADDVQRATIEASRRIAAIHGSPKRPPKKKKPTAPAKEPPDICARPPSDVPPPRGEGWRRLGPVSVVCGSNRISAPPHTSRRALTREVEVFVDGGCYSVVPADIDPGGGFCVSLDRDFAGETNMASMLYVRKKMKGGRGKGSVLRSKTGIAARHTNRVPSAVTAATTATTAAEEDDAEPPCADVLALRKAECVAAPPPPPSSARPTLAPFGSVGGTVLTGSTERATVSATRTPRTRSPAPARASSSCPFSPGMERQLDMLVMSRPEDRSSGGASTTIVREAQRRARRRAFLEQKRKASADDRKSEDLKSAKKHPPTATAAEQLKASRRAALARVASQKKKAEARRRQEEAMSDDDTRKKEAEAAERVDASRSVAAARAGAAAAEKRQQERERELTRLAEAEARRERVEAVLAYDETRADLRERQVRNETYARIRREERRREKALRRQEDERAEIIRLREGRERYNIGGASGIIPASVPPPAVQSARSFFSITGSASVSDAAGGDLGPATASSAPWEKQELGHRETWGRVGSGHAHEPEETRTGTQTRRGSAHAVQDGDELYTFESNQQRRHQQQQQQPPLPLPRSGQTRTTPRSCATAASSSDSAPSSGSSARLEVLPAASPDACYGCSGVIPPQQDDGDEVVVTGGGGLPNPGLPLTRRGYSRGARSDASATTSSGSESRNITSGSAGKQVAHDRRRIATTPVWKRPAVPLSKPYVPVPRKESGRFL
eukprot:g6523.t1